MSSPNILIWDIETAPILGHCWRRYDTTLLDIETDWYMLCFSYKWLGAKKTHVIGLDDFEGYDPAEEDDYSLMDEMWTILDKADILIHHNGDRFDLKKANARLIQNGFQPYSPVKTIDTCKLARKHFGFTSNRLDDLGNALGVGRKQKHSGYNLWTGCMNGDEKAWKDMKSYNKQDVILLENVYNELKPWVNSTNLGLYVDNGEKVCPKCGHNQLTIAGKSATNSGVYLRYQCKSCKGYSRARSKIKGTGNPLTNA